MEIMKDLEKFLLSEIISNSGLDKNFIAPDENLISSGIIDSMGILKLVSYLEKSFNIKIANEEIVPENFQTLNSLVQFVEIKIKK